MYDLIQDALGTGLQLGLTALVVLFLSSLLRDIRFVIRGKH